MSEDTPRTPPPATEAGRQALDDPTRQRPLDSGGAERPAAVEAAHGDAIAAAAAEKVAEREAEHAQREADAAHDELEKLSRKERKAREKAEKERQKAEEERRKADEAARREQAEAMAVAATGDVEAQRGDAAAAVGTHSSRAGSVSGATLASPGIPDVEPTPAPAQLPDSSDDKPEILVGAAFAGAFLFAKLLKRVANR